MIKARVPLGKFVTEYSVRNKSNEDIPVYSVTNSQGFCTEYFGKEVASQDKTTYKIVPQGYFAYNPSRINVGSVDWQRNEVRVIVSPLYNVFSVSDGIDRQYLYYFLRSDLGRQMIKSKASGSVRDNLKIEMLKEMTIPDISIEEQRFCSSMLDKLQLLIQMRQQELQMLDELIKARFVELFGDPEINPNNWEIIKIGKVIESCEAGWSGNGTQRQKLPGEIAVLKVSAVTKGFFVPEECKVLDNQSDIKKYVFPQKGDLLFSRANTREMVGATAVISQDYPELILPDKLWKIRFASCANVLYMKHILSHQSIRAKFSEASTGTSGSMFNVSMGKFKGIEIPLPPTEIQEQFAAFVEQVDKSKVAVQAALDKAQLLFDSLMQEYFG
ncbi:MAG: restriction endonuclease subunit S [Clostridiales bacterium]|nr:restriction endonuclease subunit S [Clostridiales bacterium]MDY4111810.1 restriction endonuclease subunit S [Roseburia sp.]